MTVLSRLRKELRAVGTDPSLLRRVRPARLARAFRRVTMRHPGNWEKGAAGVAVRRYPSYDAYVRHQTSKLDTLDLATYDREFRAALSNRLRAEQWKGLSVLCLAARVGSEVRAFHDLGAFAVGIDLNPGTDNDVVLPGDFHNLQFPSDCVDGVYCNSLDHALDLPQAVREIVRVLKPGGRAVIELMRSVTDPAQESWEATVWESADEVIDLFTSEGLVVQQRNPVAIPAAMEEQVIFRLPDPRSP